MSTLLTTTQLQAIKTWIDANMPTGPGVGENEQVVVLNAPSNPGYYVWKTKVTQDEIMLNGFDWARVDNLSIGKARVWEWMFDNADKAFNPSRPNIRSGVDQVWKGTAPDLVVQAVVFGHCKRTCSLAEKIMAVVSTGLPTPSGNRGAITNPDTMTFEGLLTPDDVIASYDV